MHARFTVSAKAALFTPDYSQVLIVRYPSGVQGLPGGHLERNETPDEAIRRELREELGLDVPSELTRGDFFFRANGTLILAFSGVLDTATPLFVDGNELSGAEWTHVALVTSGQVDIDPGYANFIAKIIPKGAPLS